MIKKYLQLQIKFKIFLKNKHNEFSSFNKKIYNIHQVPENLENKQLENAITL